MKVVLLHGPGIEASRRKLVELKKKFSPDEVVVFEKESAVGEILTNLQSQSLFGGERLVILENPPDDFLLPTTNYQLPTTVILWFDHEIDTKKFPKAEIYFFPEAKEVSVFPFLDFLGQKDKRAYLELDKLQRDYDSQYIITMILYLLRNLVATPKGAKDFVKRKNERMRSNFSPEELVNLYKSVLEIDFKIKSGLLEPVQAEFLFVNLFCHQI